MWLTLTQLSANAQATVTNGVMFPHQFFYKYRYRWPRPQFSHLDIEVALVSTHISQLLLLVISSSQSRGSLMNLPDDRERIA